jgi:DNA-binding transcriptional regulator GbsR (MarR family)
MFGMRDHLAMTEGESAFVEEMGQALATYGMTPMAGRMWGWLLICEPPEQTAADLAEALQASRGAISGTARMLTTAGMIRRTTRRGDRREYFSAPPEALDSFLENAGRIYRQFREIAEHGLDAIADHPPASRRRLEQLRDVFAFVEQEVPTVVDRFLRDRAEPTGRKEPA